MDKSSRKSKKSTSTASKNSIAPATSANEDISQQIDPTSATITVSAVEVPELTEEENRDRLHLESKWRGHFLKQVKH